MSEQLADDALRLYIERIERLEEEKKGVADDVRDVYSEAKGDGFDTKIMRKIIGLRKMSDQDRAEADALLETYKAALGMSPRLDLGEGADFRAKRRGKAKIDDEAGAALKRLRESPIPMSMSVGGGPMVPINQAAADLAQANV